MLNLLVRGAPGFTAQALAPGWSLPEGVVWIDLVSPTREEELAVEAALGLDLPTPEEMAQIEPSSRLYQEAGATFMTATLLARSEADVPITTPVTFVLARNILVTLRYQQLKAFTVFAQRAQQNGEVTTGSEALFGLLDAIIERLAEVMELGSEQVQATSAEIFNRSGGGGFEPLLTGLARTQSTVSLARTSLGSLGRLTSFAALASEIAHDPECRAHLTSLQQDVQSLNEHSGFLSTHISFLLDAALGLINIEQNGIMKIFALATVLLMPPTLVGAIYGMNFEHMPELHWMGGYPFALVLMLASGLIPFLWFRKKGWF